MPKEINVAVIGVGLVGAEFISQLLNLNDPAVSFTLVSVSSSTKTVFAAEGLGKEWKKTLDQSTEKPSVDSLLSKIRGLQGKNVVVDNTSSESIAESYPLFLNAGINVITPNKKAFSGPLSLYENIIAASQKEGGGRFLNESTVGAGLPIISTLKELVKTGDRVKKIEGVFSGTMSYIFNNYSSLTSSGDGPAFAGVVKEAREKGYTEPHPADDLNGFDVARKLTILSRTIDHKKPALESFKAVQTESLIPPALENIQSGDEFVARLPEFDADFHAKREAAKARGGVLRFVGVVDVQKGVVQAKIEECGPTHPFATSLGGSDNIVLFHTERYGDRPLIVQGAGAGAAVTAMGVLGDLLKLV